MLEPNDRQLYVEALRPPLGYRLCEAIATTYSLDMTTLLGIPIALVLPHVDARRQGPETAVMMLEALRRSSRRITVFCDRGEIAAPAMQHVLYPLLERVIVEVQAPHGGCLHSKLWLLSYEREEDGEGEPLVMRLAVLSRNLTADRCWDVSLVMDGAITGQNKAANGPLCEMLQLLPSLATHAPDPKVVERVTKLSNLARKTRWELPDGYDELRFHCLGLGPKARRWLPEDSDRLLVISPFVRDRALQELAESTREPVALISRGEELDQLSSETRALFGKCLVLHERAETEEGEDLDAEASSTASALVGLHAKVYVAKRGWDTHVYLGSGNATNAALITGTNIEILAELVGKTSKVKGIDRLLDNEGGLAALLADYTPCVRTDEAEKKAAEDALDRVRRSLATSGLQVRFDKSDDTASDYVCWLIAPTAIDLTGATGLRAWLVTQDRSSARDATALAAPEPVQLAACSTASATGLIAFDLVNEHAHMSFVLNLAMVTPPVDRDAQVTRMVIDNRDRFFALLLALLETSDSAVFDRLDAGRGGEGAWAGASAGHGLLERLIRAKARDPRRLEELRALVSELQSTTEGQAVMPADFAAVWEAINAEDVA